MADQYAFEKPNYIPWQFPYIKNDGTLIYKKTGHTALVNYDAASWPKPEPFDDPQHERLMLLVEYLHAFYWYFIGGTPPKDGGIFGGDTLSIIPIEYQSADFQ